MQLAAGHCPRLGAYPIPLRGKDPFGCTGTPTPGSTAGGRRLRVAGFIRCSQRHRFVAGEGLRHRFGVHAQWRRARHRGHVVPADGQGHTHFPGKCRPRLGRGGTHSGRGWAGSVYDHHPAIDAARHSRRYDHCLFRCPRRIRRGHHVRLQHSLGNSDTAFGAVHGLQQPGGEHAAARLACLSLVLGLGGLLLSEWLARRLRRLLGR